jgi:hypothetical protein
MAEFIFAGEGATNLSTLTYGEAKAMAAEVVGASADPARVAPSALKRARRWLLREEWHYLQVKGEGVIIPANAEEVSLPAPIRSIIHIRVGTTIASTELEYVPFSTAMHQMAGGYSAGGTFYYTFDGTLRTGKISLIGPWGDTPGIMDIWYIRPIIEPTRDEETLDLLEGPMELAYLDMASYYIGLNEGAPERVVQGYAASAAGHYVKARGMDKRVYGQILGFLPPQVWDRPANVLRRGPRPAHYHRW